MKQPTIGFAGLTHLGVNSAVAAAARGFTTVAFDLDGKKAATLGRGRLPFFEPGLEALFAGSRARLRFTADAASLAECDVVFVAPDVPTDDRGASDLAGLRRLLETVSALDAPFTLVVLSQVPPGFTRRLPARSGSVYYQVETLAFGMAVERATKPERFIVGCADPARPLPDAYAAYLAAFGCPILPMRYESAELAKIAINCCLVAAVSTANTLAEICEGIGADWSEIVPALRLDRRIGQHAYLEAGLGLAGGNLERDLATVQALGAEAGADTRLIAAEVANSRHRKDWAVRVLHRELARLGNPAPTVGLLGLAYKQDTDSVKNSPSVALAEALGNARLQAYDPQVAEGAVALPNLARARDPLGAATGADAVALMTPWPEFRALDVPALARAMAGRIVLDPYGLLEAERCRRQGLEHHRLGVA